ncbi:hypothetical protein ACFLVC_03035 [Chloroflexota bacterium]
MSKEAVCVCGRIIVETPEGWQHKKALLPFPRKCNNPKPVFGWKR